jgi:hypothetical protein
MMMMKQGPTVLPIHHRCNGADAFMIPMMTMRMLPLDMRQQLCKHRMWLS